MRSVLIADDEMLARRLLGEYLKSHVDLVVVAECDNGLDAAKQIGELQPDLVLLDIQRPRLTGLEVLEVTGRRHGVIFTTAYDQHAMQAFDLLAVDYLLKPFSQNRFDNAQARARALAIRDAPLEALRQQTQPVLTRLVVREREQIHILPLDNIECIEAQDDYIGIHCAGRCHLKHQRLGDIEQQLDTRAFVRVHRSWIVNLQQIIRLERRSKDSQYLHLHSGRQVPVSRSGLERLQPLL